MLNTRLRVIRFVIAAFLLIFALWLHNSAHEVLATEIASLTLSETDDILVCDSDSITINLNNVHDLYGYEFKLLYDAEKLGVEAVFENEWFDTGSDAAIPVGWEANCAEGICRFAVSRLNPSMPLSGSGVVATVLLEPLSAGTSNLEISDVILSDIDGYRIAVDVADSLNVTSCGITNIQGQISLQGRPTPIDSGWVTLTDPHGVFGPYIVPFDADDGSYSFSDVKVLPEGTTYELSASHALYLTNVQKLPLQEGDSIIEKTTLLGGDANNDSTVSIADLTCIAGSFNDIDNGCTNEGSADINKDGVVNIQDMTLTGGNFQRSSPQNW